jgi:hypothetical protein
LKTQPKRKSKILKLHKNTKCLQSPDLKEILIFYNYLRKSRKSQRELCRGDDQASHSRKLNDPE